MPGAGLHISCHCAMPIAAASVASRICFLGRYLKSTQLVLLRMWSFGQRSGVGIWSDADTRLELLLSNRTHSTFAGLSDAIFLHTQM